MQNQKLLKNLFVLLLGLCLASPNLFAFATPPISRQALMKHIFAPTLFSMYSKDYGMLYCQLYGVAGVSKSFKNDTCEVSARAVKEMRHFAMQYTRNKVFWSSNIVWAIKAVGVFCNAGESL